MNPFMWRYRNHLLNQKKKITTADLKKETLLLLEEGHCLREQALEACSMAAAQAETGFRATSLETLRHLVAVGAGVTLLPALSTNSNLQPLNLAIKPFNDPSPSRSIGILWRHSSAREKCCGVITTLIRDQITKQPKLKSRKATKIMQKELTL